MFRWAKQALADVAGTQEPIYGPSAIKSVAEEAKETPYTELTRDHLKWQKPDYTCVETKTFYFFTDEGRMVFCQVIYSNVAGIKVTCQFNVKVFSADLSEPHIWCTSPLNNVEFSEDRSAFYADDCAVELTEDGNSYSIKSMNDERAIINLKITKVAPGYQAGKTGKSLFGTDPEKPWGSMRHAFWPRCATEGTITTKEGTIDMKGRSIFVYALQGMKPHHAAARWNFAVFHSPNYSLVLMEFTTPPSYGTTKVSVGGIAKDGELIAVGCDNVVTHKAAKKDTDNDWPEPSAIEFKWLSPTKDGKPVEGVIDAEVGSRIDRVDIMSEVPGFVKKIVSGAAGTRPWIYQYAVKPTLNLNIRGETISETGQLYNEATFICDI